MAHTEKEAAAINSVIAASGLTLLKIIVGFVTGSLGIIAEAAHSGLDLFAAIVTVMAVKTSGKPADKKHHYGHGKIENLSALFETFLLLVTCFWIISAALKRIISGHIEIDVNIWSFGVMFISIFVDLSRSRMLHRAARKFNSQALEADALHFSTDIWSSSVVILGLFCVKLSDWLKGYEFLHYADTVAAMLVGALVIYISIKLGMKAIHSLLDATPEGLEEKIIMAVEALPGILDCHNVRIRFSGPQPFVDLHVLVDGKRPLKEVHRLTEEVEMVTRKFVANADVTVHPEPE